MSGKVWLVGAGPGDPELLTLRAARVLAEAEVVLYDALVDRRLLALAFRALHLPVGKRAGRASTSQAEIDATLVRTARAGRRVVRLKCGDPFVFGRGGEEALALAAAGVDFEIVPGVSSAIAGPSAAGIPVTHRGVARGFAVLTAQPSHAWHATVDALPPKTLTLVFLMALAARDEIAMRLVSRGWPPTTPAALVLGAHTEQAWHWIGTLAGLGAAVIPAQARELPGLIVVGDVVSIGEALAARKLEDHLAIA